MYHIKSVLLEMTWMKALAKQCGFDDGFYGMEKNEAQFESEEERLVYLEAYAKGSNHPFGKPGVVYESV